MNDQPLPRCRRCFGEGAILRQHPNHSTMMVERPCPYCEATGVERRTNEKGGA